MSWQGDATGSPSPSTCVNDMTGCRGTHSDHPDHVRQRGTPAGSAARERGNCELTVAAGGCALAGTCPVRWVPPELRVSAVSTSIRLVPVTPSSGWANTGRTGSPLLSRGRVQISGEMSHSSLMDNAGDHPGRPSCGLWAGPSLRVKPCPLTPQERLKPLPGTYCE